MNDTTLYCSIEDLYDACQKNAVDSWAKDDSRSADSEIETVIKSAIARSSEEMNLYLAKQYHLPLPYVPLPIKDIAVKLALYQLLSRKGMDAESRDKTIKANRDSAIRQLEMIASGKLVITILSDEGDALPNSRVAHSFPNSPFRPTK